MRMNGTLETLFPAIRAGVLSATLLQPEHWWFVKELARHLGTTPSKLKRELELLVSMGLLLRRQDGRHTYFKANAGSPLFPDLCALLEKTSGLETARNSAPKRFQIDRLKVEVHADKESAGRAAAQEVAEYLRRMGSAQDSLAVIFATGASQLDMLRALVAAPDIPWNKIVGFHLDEYVDLDENHPASFRRYLRENLTSRVRMREFFPINGSSPDHGAICRKYAERMCAAAPRLCLLGVGENGHLAFNEPAEADFHDPADVKMVTLDATCRQQQTAEGWFGSIEEVPARAITVTIPALFRVPRLILTIPGKRKAQIVRRAFTEPISTDCPATILRTHPDATVYLDLDSAAELD
jgi:glucosamine-6-phosphate deaminase